MYECPFPDQCKRYAIGLLRATVVTVRQDKPFKECKAIFEIDRLPPTPALSEALIS